MSDIDNEMCVALYQSISAAMQAHSCVITAFYENETDFMALDENGAGDRRRDIDQLTAEMLRLSKCIMAEPNAEAQ